MDTTCTTDVIDLDGRRAAEQVRAVVTVAEAVRRCDAPWEHPTTPRQVEGRLRHGWDLDAPTGFVTWEDGRPVAVAEYSTSSYDNPHLAWVHVQVHPDHRRRGHGSALLRLLVDRARGEGRTSVGTFGWDADAPRGFAARHGLPQVSVAVNRRQVLAEVDRAAVDRAHEAALPHAAAYELVRWPTPTPDADLPALAELTAAINDAPTDDLDVEDDVFPPERVHAYEVAQQARGHRLYRLVARHRDTGELAGQTVVAVDGERPELGDQHDTSVVAAHRGHRLGLLLKSEMMRWLATDEPQLVSIDTWNAESNDQMIGVNELLGYRVVGRELVFQMSV